VGGQTLLERIVKAMMGAGITEFVIVTGYRADQIRDFIANGPLDPLGTLATNGKGYGSANKARESQEWSMVNSQSSKFTFLHNADYENNNNIYSLWMAGEVVRGREFLLMDSDILCASELVERIAREPVTALAVNRHELGDEEMKVVVDADGRITEISKTCSPQEAMGESVGIEKMTAEYSEALYRELDQMILQEGLIDIFYERAFERLIPQGHTFKVVDTTDYFSFEIDTPEDLQEASRRIKQIENAI
jgi:choline kinase